MLGSDIQRTCGLIGNDEGGFQCYGDSDQHARLHATGQLGIVEANPVEQFDHSGAPRLAVLPSLEREFPRPGGQASPPD